MLFRSAEALRGFPVSEEEKRHQAAGFAMLAGDLQQAWAVDLMLRSAQTGVRPEVAAAMAEGVRRVMNTTYAVATTGLSEGGDEFGNPEGTVWIGVAGPAGTMTRKYHCDLGRTGNIRRFANVALRFLASYISKNLTSE